MKITAEEQEQNKRNIIREAFTLYCERGIEKISIRDVSKRAKVSESTIYRYFGNKPQLVLSTLSVLWKEISNSLDVEAEHMDHYGEMTGYEQLDTWLECCRRLYLDNSDYVLFSYEAKLYLVRNETGLGKDLYDMLMESIKEPCMAAIDKGKADRSILVQTDTEDLFYAIWGTVRGYIVKIVIYDALCAQISPWRSRYGIVKDGILRALRSE